MRRVVQLWHLRASVEGACHAVPQKSMDQEKMQFRDVIFHWLLELLL